MKVKVKLFNNDKNDVSRFAIAEVEYEVKGFGERNGYLVLMLKSGETKAFHSPIAELTVM